MLVHAQAESWANLGVGFGVLPRWTASKIATSLLFITLTLVTILLKYLVHPSAQAYLA